MRVTSAEANKALKVLYDEKEKWLSDELQNRTYNVAIGEDPAALKPDYVFAETQDAVDAINNKILKLKHAINKFNTTTLVGETGLTVDQVLIKLPMLKKRQEKLARMRLMPAKKRERITGNIIDYVYTAFDPAEADHAYTQVTTEIADLQLALDKVNNSVTFEI